MNKKNNTNRRRTTAAARQPALRQCVAVCLLQACLCAGMPAHAAGGHHAVDDAALLDPGQCQLETWWGHDIGGARTLLHAGPGCRVGAVEVGLSVDHLRQIGSGSTSITGAQVKWARPVVDGWSAGIVLAVAAQDRSPRALGSTAIVPITWQTTETLLTHVNLGRDFRHGQPDTNRAGLALEWSPLSAWSLVAERFREGGANFWRAGARWALTPSTSIDLSRARGLGNAAPAGWTLGLTWVVDR